MKELESYVCGYFDFNAVADASEREKVKKAYDFAKKAHGTQKRKSGEDYFCHPVAIANMLLKMGGDADTICAALLHDTVEDTEATIEDIEKLVGPDVARIVDGVTKITGLSSKIEELQDLKIESLRKWFQEMQKDIRVALVKLADRIHNLETLEGHNNSEKEKKIAQTSLDVFARIAQRLGIREWAIKIEDLAFIHLSKDDYDHTLNLRKEVVAHGEKFKKELESKLREENICKFELEYEIPGVYELYKYFRKANTKEIFMKNFAYRMNIVVENEECCYRLLYLVHKYFRRKKGSFEDYVNTPYINGYRGIHTNVFLPGGEQMLLRIRDEKMQDYAMHGVLSLLKNRNFDPTDHKLPWMTMIQYVIDDTKGNSENFLDTLDKDILKHNTLVYAEKDHVYILPSHATVLDALFFIYGEKALYTQTIFVNGLIVPFYHVIDSGSKIEAEFTQAKNYHYKWLLWVETALSKSFLKDALKSESCERKLEMGRYIIEQHFKLFYNTSILLYDIEKAITRKYDSIDKLYIAIAEGEIEVEEVASQILPQYLQKKEKQKYVFYIHFNRTETIEHILNELQIHNLTEIKQRKKMFTKDTYRLSITLSEYDFVKIERTLNALKNIPEVISVETESLKTKRKEYYYITTLIVVWAFDPVVASQLLDTQQDANMLTFMRFFVVTGVLGIYWLMLKGNKVYLSTKRKIITSSEISASVALFFMVFFSYVSLRFVSPLLYNNFMIFVTMVLSITAVSTINIGRKYQIGYLGICLILLFGLAGFTLSAEITVAFSMLAAMLFYTLYLYFSNKVDGFLKTKADLIRSQFLIHFLPLVVTTLLLFFNGVDLNLQKIGIFTAFAIIFNFLPLFLYRRYSLLSAIKPKRAFQGLFYGLIFCFLVQVVAFKSIPPLFDLILVSGTLVAFLIQIFLTSSSRRIS